MTAFMHILIDLILLAILVLFVLRGRKKGLILTLFGLAAFFVAVFGARFLSAQLAPVAADALTPHFTVLVEQQMDADTGAKLEEFLASDHQDTDRLAEILDSVGLYRPLADSIHDLLSRENVTNAVTALAHAIAEVVSAIVIFILAFLLILLGWFLLSRILNLAARLPILKGLNRLLGAILGLVEGMLFLFFAAWVLRLWGDIIPAEVVESSILLDFFLHTNPVSLITGI